VILKITRFPALSFIDIFFSLFTQFIGNPFGLSLKEGLLILIQPTLFYVTICYPIEMLYRFAQMFDSMIPIPDLVGIIEMLSGQIPNPSGTIGHHLGV
jgi:hypothetical protein